MSRVNKDIFTLFDKKAEGKIAPGQLADYLRAIGYNPTNQQVEDILKGHNGDLTLSSIEGLVREHENALEATTQYRAEDFVRAFQVFDKEDTGKVSVGDLKYMLTGLGEKLSDEEVEELLKGVEVVDGEVDYRRFIEDVLRQ